MLTIGTFLTRRSIATNIKKYGMVIYQQFRLEGKLSVAVKRD